MSHKRVKVQLICSLRSKIRDRKSSILCRDHQSQTKERTFFDKDVSNFCYSGFCFLEYESHKAASLAKRRLETGRIKVWSCDIIVDWADPQEEPDEETMSQVSLLYHFQM